MPSLGLLLEEPIFASYNSRMNTVNEKHKPDSPDYRPMIDFEPYRSQINEFKDQFIYKNMREIEDRDGLYVVSPIFRRTLGFLITNATYNRFDAWIRMVDNYAGNDLLYLNPEGIIPDVAIIKKGDKRENPFRERRVFDATSFSEGDHIKIKLQQAEDGRGEDEDGEDGDSDREAKLDKKQLAETEG